MASERKKLPGALLLTLSALGFLFSLLIVFVTAISVSSVPNLTNQVNEGLPLLSSGMLALLVAGLHLPAMLLAIRYLRGLDITAKCAFLFKPASFSLVFWFTLLGAGFLVARFGISPLFLAPLTAAAVAIPVWWLVEFSRRGLPRSNALREWGTLSVGLSASPLVIIVIEVLLVALIAIAVLITLSTQPGAMAQLAGIFQNMEMVQGSLEELENIVVELARNPLIAAALFLAVGLVAPFIEEIFKPMAIWFLLKRPMKDDEGFSLGLISGGAFALLESAGLVAQIRPDTWLAAVVMRAATGLLHIGLSGLVGYGLVHSWNRKRFAHSVLYLLAAGGLHGAWNSLALLSGFTTTALPAAADFRPGLGGAVSIAGLLAVFGTVLYIILRVNRTLRLKTAVTPPAAEILNAE